MSQDIIDLNEVLERVQDDKELLVELIDIFLEDCPPKIKKIREEAEKDNFDEVADLAHSLKGSSGNLAAKDLQALFLQIEQKGKGKELSGLEDMLQTVEEKVEDVRNYLEKLKEKFKNES